MEKIRKQIIGEAIPQRNSVSKEWITEREVLNILVKYLRENGWKVKEQTIVEDGKIDVGAEKEGKVFLIEAKGEDRGGYTSAEMNFQIGLGQLMSRMKYHEAEYGLAFPLTRDFIKVLQKYRGSFAFEKLEIYLIPVNKDGSCELISPHDISKFLNLQLTLPLGNSATMIR